MLFKKIFLLILISIIVIPSLSYSLNQEDIYVWSNSSTPLEASTSLSLEEQDKATETER